MQRVMQTLILILFCGCATDNTDEHHDTNMPSFYNRVSPFYASYNQTELTGVIHCSFQRRICPVKLELSAIAGPMSLYGGMSHQSCCDYKAEESVCEAKEFLEGSPQTISEEIRLTIQDDNGVLLTKGQLGLKPNVSGTGRLSNTKDSIYLRLGSSQEVCDLNLRFANNPVL
ncbi:MAG: hypothetical protein H3C47_03070 [Candidatus Cloacimonetes bacterium]|nr:hypothetical protein [Candidatus Cloacimonadota bacterium]